jgi:hypothetical protein
VAVQALWLGRGDHSRAWRCAILHHQTAAVLSTSVLHTSWPRRHNYPPNPPVRGAAAATGRAGSHAMHSTSTCPAHTRRAAGGKRSVRQRCNSHHPTSIKHARRCRATRSTIHTLVTLHTCTAKPAAGTADRGGRMRTALPPLLPAAAAASARAPGPAAACAMKAAVVRAPAAADAAATGACCWATQPLQRTNPKQANPGDATTSHLTPHLPARPAPPAVA